MVRRPHALALLVALASGPACADGPGPLRPRTEPAPSWAGELRQTFDDSLDSSAIGVSMDGRSPAADPLLQVRAKTADVVARMTIVTVTRDGNGERAAFQLTLRLEPNPLVLRGVEGNTVELLVPQDTEAFGLVSGYESALRGRTFIGFLRLFAGPEGPVFHWHLTADAQDVAQAAALALDLDSR